MNKLDEIYDYFWKIYEETHGGMLFRHYLDELYELIEEHKKIKDKTTPKKPIVRGLSGAMYTCVHTCPVCGKELIVTNNETVIYKAKTNYCDECGQKLDWSDTNE